MREKIIFHIDVNSAFLSWSAVKRLKEDPGSVDLRTIPAVVGGDPTTRHGIVTAKSLPAKKYGIHTADTIASAMRRCPGLVVIPSDFATYREYSHKFLDILRSYTTEVEQASIDEAYLDATLLCARGEAALLLAAQIRRQVRETLGFTVNVGISSNRLLAKMASDFQKPDRTHTLFPEEVEEKMWPLPIGDLYGCGRRTADRLRSLGIRTIGDAANAPETVLTDHLGEKAGKYIHRAARGIGRAAVYPVREDAKSYSNEFTTSSDIRETTYESEFLPLLEHLCDKVAGRLQRDGVYGKTVVVTVKTDDFRRRSAQARLSDVSNDAKTIYRMAVNLSDKLLLGEKGLFAEGAGIRLVGAGVTDLDDGSFRQVNLFDWLESSPEPGPTAGLTEAGPGSEPAVALAEAGLEPESAVALTEADPGPEPAGVLAEAGLEPESAVALTEAGPGPEPVALAETDPERGVTQAAARRKAEQTDRSARLTEMEALINRRFGDGAVRKGAGQATGDGAVHKGTGQTTRDGAVRKGTGKQ